MGSNRILVRRASESPQLRRPFGMKLATSLPMICRRTRKMEFFEKVVDWIEYPWAWISVPNPPYENWKAQKNKVKAELVSTMRDSTGGWQRCSSTCPLPWGRGPTSAPAISCARFSRQTCPPGSNSSMRGRTRANIWRSVCAGRFQSRVSTQDAATRPNPMAKERVFHSGQALEEVSRQAAVGEPQLSEFLERARMLFTVQQMRDALNEVLTRPRAKTGTVA